MATKVTREELAEVLKEWAVTYTFSGPDLWAGQYTSRSVTVLAKTDKEAVVLVKAKYPSAFVLTAKAILSRLDAEAQEAEPKAKTVVSYSVTYTIECPQCRIARYVTVVGGKIQKSICNNCGNELKLFPDMAGQEVAKEAGGEHKLKPCPFHKPNPDSGISWCDDDDDYWCECAACGAQGPYGTSPEHAAELWNRRLDAELEEAAKEAGGEHKQYSINQPVEIVKEESPKWKSH